MRDHLSIFISLDEEGEQPQDAPADQPTATVLNENLDKSVEELELSVRSYNCLKNANIRTIRDLVQKTEARDAEDEELRPQVAQRDQGDPAQHGARRSACGSTSRSRSRSRSKQEG